ncbi:MAG: hypothetical protein JWQ11_608 [Rhizobacter sp.]|nr:hypothetical protein [Rhizobacter sp.]
MSSPPTLVEVARSSAVLDPASKGYVALIDGQPSQFTGRRAHQRAEAHAKAAREKKAGQSIEAGPAENRLVCRTTPGDALILMMRNDTPGQTYFFNATVESPGRVGVYRVQEYPRLHHNHSHYLRGPSTRYWDGKTWRVDENEGAAESVFGKSKRHFWCGLIENPSVTQ